MDDAHDQNPAATGSPSPSPHAWERLKRLTFIVDAQRPFAGPSLGEPDAHGVRHLSSGESSDELVALERSLYDMGFVAPEFSPAPDAPLTATMIPTLSLPETCRYITAIIRGARFVDGLVESEVNNGHLQNLCRRAYALALTEDGWPVALETGPDGRVPVGLRFVSLSGAIEGRTTGGRRRCPATCPGWLVGVLWETGQQMHICTEGWHFDPLSRELRVVGGGEISARFVSPPPLGEPPRPREQWPSRDELARSAAWADAG